MPQPGGSGGMPGQAGSWDPNAAPPPPPAPAAGGQNQNLRKALGLGMKAYAQGISNVPAPDPNQPPTQFLPPPTPNNPGPPMPDALNRALSFQLGPFAMGAAAQYGAGAAPAMPNGQPGGSVPTGAFAPGSFGAHGAPNFGQNTPAPPPAPVATQRVGRAAGVGMAPPVLGPALDAAIAGRANNTVVHPNPGGAPIVKTVNDPTQVDVLSTLTGLPRHQVHMMSEPQGYSRDEFIKAARSIPAAQMQQLWNMQHYLTPEQQFLPTLLKQHYDTASAAKQKMDEATAAGRMDDYAAAKKIYDDATGGYNNTLLIGGTHQPMAPLLYSAEQTQQTP